MERGRPGRLWRRLVLLRVVDKPHLSQGFHLTRLIVLSVILVAAWFQFWLVPRQGFGATVEAGLDALVTAGERWWTQSPDARNPVACATCHYDPAETRWWAASFPKFKPFPPPHSRVMTLLQANAEAVARHYGLPDALRAATAITAYLMAQGRDVPISPGISAGQPVFPTRMQALAASVRRGERLYARRCSHCHDPVAIAPSVTAFPRTLNGRPESIESFLERHRTSGQPLAWDEQAMADLIAYLMSHLTGRPVGLQPEHATKGGP